MHVHWVQQLTRFWNRMLSMEGGDRLVKWAWEDNLALMHEGADLRTGSPCWCRKWYNFLLSAPTDSGTLVWLTELDEEAVVARAKEAYLRAASTGGGSASTQPTPTQSATSSGLERRREQGGALSGSSSRDGGRCQAAGLAPTGQAPAANKFKTYLECVRGDTPFGELAPHLFEGVVRDTRHRASLSRFRCSCHDLRVERDRYLPSAVKPPRHMRTCLMCASSLVEDDLHMVFDCPLYAPLRFQFADLFSTSHSLDSFLYQNQDRLAQFVYACSETRRNAAQMSFAGSENALS